MQWSRRQWLASQGAWVASGCSVAGVALAQPATWPSRTVTLTVPFAAGGGTDTLARTLAERLGSRFGQTFVVENKPGAGGNIGAEGVALDKSAHMLLFTTASVAVNRSLYANLKYDITRDFRPVALVSSSPLVLVVGGKSAVDSVDALARAAAAKAGGLDFGSPGAGTTSHLGGALLAQLAGFKAVHVPYRGAGPLVTALAAGQLDYSLMAAVAAMPHLRSGQLRALGIAGRKPLPELATAPRLAERYAALEVDNWQALFAPNAVPAAAAVRLSTAVTEILTEPEVRSRVYADGATPVGLAPDATAKFLQREIERYAKLVKDTGAKVE
jgi:tripartite-type tricarboxylate transporter receptor subunit TctC